MPELKNTNKLIRERLKLCRSTLSSQQLSSAANDLGKQFCQHQAQLSSNKIATYLSSNGEISPHQITSYAPNSRFFLPKITSMHRATMAFYPSSHRLIRNRFNILEPIAKGAPENIRHFDLILVPLVAFDRSGNRLGMGGGFYDRALAFKNHHLSTPRPRLIGVAHHFQEVDNITPQPWDVRLDGILTDQEFIRISI